MNQKNETQNIELRITEVKREMEQLYASLGENRKPSSLVKSYISDIDDTAMTREEYYRLLVKKKMELEHYVDINMKFIQNILQTLFEGPKEGNKFVFL